MTLKRFVGLLYLMASYRHKPWKAVLRHDPCSYCGLREDEIPGGTGKKYRTGNATKMTVEHIFPRMFNVTRGWENQTSACWNCNHDRGSTPLMSFLLQRRSPTAKAA